MKKKILSYVFVIAATLSMSGIAAAVCPDLIVLSDGRECTVIKGNPATGSCYYSCSGTVAPAAPVQN